MSMLLCSVCDELFDSDDQVEAQYDPPVCEDCLMELAEEDKNWWNQLDQDPEAIADFCEDKL